MTRFQLRFAGSFPDGILSDIERQLQKSDLIEKLVGVVLLAPENDGDFNTERLTFETADVDRKELFAIRRALRKLPALRKKGVVVDTYEVAGYLNLASE